MISVSLSYKEAFGKSGLTGKNVVFSAAPWTSSSTLPLFHKLLQLLSLILALEAEALQLANYICQHLLMMPLLLLLKRWTGCAFKAICIELALNVLISTPKHRSVWETIMACS